MPPQCGRMEISMNKVRIILSVISKGLKLLFNKISFNKIKINKNKKTKIVSNQTQNVSVTIQRNEGCEIAQNNFCKK